MQEPGINFCDFKYLLNGHQTAPERLTDDKYPLVIDPVHARADFLITAFPQVRHHQGRYLHFNGTYSFHHSGLKGIRDCHYLAGGLHLGTQGMVSINKFIKRPAWEFHNTVIKGRLKTGNRFSGNGIFDFVQPVTYCDFRGNLGDWIAGRLGSKCG